MKEIHDATYLEANNTADGSQKSSLEVSSPVDSMESLVVWNLSKALERNRALNFREAISELQKTMEKSSCELNTAVFGQPQERHLACALLAWQQLHRSADSLIQFAELKREKLLKATNEDVKSEIMLRKSSEEIDTASILQKQSFVMGPVVALPIHTKLMMRVERTSSANKPKTNTCSPTSTQRVMKKLEEESGCVELGCVAKLKELDRGTNELRERASKLSRREAERAELLERAEIAWRELEIGFQRRLRIADEKEEQYATRIETLVEERKELKQTCVKLIAEVKEKADALEKQKNIMHKCETEVCQLACLCHQLNKEVLTVDSSLGQAAIKLQQLDRECQLKEEQARRRTKNLESKLESAKQFTSEAELALCEELTALRDQIETVSAELLSKDDQSDQLRADLEQLSTVKMTLVDDLEACSLACNRRLQRMIAELKIKGEQLLNARQQVLESACQAPVEAAVEARRTPSLAALCCCPLDGTRNEDACSCTSLRTKLLNDLLEELFSGLRTEVSDSLYGLPCQMLKCLEYKHNWDKASAIKTNLQVYFSKLLVEELDIAIAKSIERYHVKWVGSTCADSPSTREERRGARARPVPGSLTQLDPQGVPCTQARMNCGCWNGDDMRQRVEQLANQTFDKRINELQLTNTPAVTTDGSRNKSMTMSGHRNSVPQESLRESEERDQSVLYCQMPRLRKSGKEDDILPAYLKRTHNDVNQIRAQIEDLKKETIKKTDLKTMEEKIVKLLQTAQRPESQNPYANNTINEDCKYGMNPKQKIPKNVSLESTILHNCRNAYIEHNSRNIADMNKTILNHKKRPIKDFTPAKRFSKISVYGSGQFNKSPQKVFKSPAYAVNMCLCPERKEQPGKTVFRQDCIVVKNLNVADSPPRWAKTFSPEVKGNKNDLEEASQLGLEVLKESEPLPISDKEIPCHENSLENINAFMAAFINKSSTTSVDRLLNVLNKWKTDLNTSLVNNENKLDLNNEIITLNNSDTQLDSNVQNMKNKSDQPRSFKARAQTRNIYDSHNPTKNIMASAKKQNVNNHRNNLQLINKAVDSPAKLFTNIADIKKIPDNLDLSYISQHALNRNPSVGGFQDFLPIISKSHHSLGHKTDFNQKDSNKNQLASNSEYMSQVSYNNKSIKATCKSTSYENNSKCDINNENKTKLQYKNPSRGTEAYSCDFKDSDSPTKIKSYNISNSQADANGLVSRSKEKESAKSFNPPLPVANPATAKPEQHCLIKLPKKSNQSSKNIMEILKKSEALSSEYDYSVKFLGVTLNNRKNESDSESFLLNNFKYEEEKCNKKKTEECRSGVLRGQLNEDCRTMADQVTSCHCHNKFEDLKQYFNELLFNCKTVVANQDKSLDAQSFKNTKDFCFCRDESQSPDDLEVNTFELIKDHLKSKLENMKLSTSKFTYLPYEEEERLLTTILLKVKQVISESTKHTCRCTDTSTGKGSWNRAYALLQEYLKSKIKRVQCVCGSPSISEENVILPDVLDKVCKLIEDDFDRIKNICHTSEVQNHQELPDKKTCHTHLSNSVTVNHVGVIRTVLPDYDKTVQVCKEDSQQTCFKHHKEISKQSFLKTENISSQVSKNFGDIYKRDIGSCCQKSEEIRSEEFKCTDFSENREETAQDPIMKCSKIISCQSSINNTTDNVRNEKMVSEMYANSENDNFKFKEHHVDINPRISDTRCSCDTGDSSQVPEKTLSNHIPFNDYICDTDKSTILKHDEIMLKYIDQNQSNVACATNKNEKPSDFYQQQCMGGTIQVLGDPESNKKISNVKSKMYLSVNDNSRNYPTCDCSLIPLCNVKMLVENIEDKLANSKCTCDSFSSYVCPIHSKLKSY